MASVPQAQTNEDRHSESPQATVPDWGFFRLAFSDYRYHYRYRQEGIGRSLALMAPRIMLSPSVQFAILVRMAQRGPRWLVRLVGYLQVMLFSCEFFTFNEGPGIELGAAIDYPHPFGIIVGPGTVIGSRVSIYHQTMIGTNRRWYPGDELQAPVIGDDVVIGGASRVLGKFNIGEGAVIGLNVFVREDVEPGSTVLLSGVKAAAEWDDPRRDGREPPPPEELAALSPYAPRANLD